MLSTSWKRKSKPLAPMAFLRTPVPSGGHYLVSTHHGEGKRSSGGALQCAQPLGPAHSQGNSRITPLPELSLHRCPSRSMTLIFINRISCYNRLWRSIGLSLRGFCEVVAWEFHLMCLFSL